MTGTLTGAQLGWLLRTSVLLHIAAVVVWFGAVAYFLLVLRPSMAAAGLDRPARYALLVAIKRRLKRVVGAAVVVLIATGLLNARLRGYLGGDIPVDAFRQRVFHLKLGVASVLVLVFLTALPLLQRVRTPRLRGRLFVAVHVVVLALGLVAAAAGVILAR